MKALKECVSKFYLRFIRLERNCVKCGCELEEDYTQSILER